MEDLTLQQILEALPQINASRNNWFVRTNGGQYYDNFINGKFIAIGYDKILLSDIKKASDTGDEGISKLGDKIREQYGEEEFRPNYVASQLIKFTYGIKKGDIVLIPSYSSAEFTFGEIMETPVYLEEIKDTETSDICPYRKRKKVKWFRSMDRDALDPNLYRLMFSHHAISEADAYADFIDKISNSFFIKDQKAHLILDVKTTDEIKARDLFQMGSITLDLLDEFCKDEGLPFKSDDFNIKLNLQSPGLIELSGLTMGGVVLIGIILVSIAGGGFEFKWKKDLSANIKTEGIIQKVKEFLTSRSNIQAKKAILEKHMKDLQIKEPEDLIKVLNELNKK